MLLRTVEVVDNLRAMKMVPPYLLTHMAVKEDLEAVLQEYIRIILFNLELSTARIAEISLTIPA